MTGPSKCHDWRELATAPDKKEIFNQLLKTPIDALVDIVLDYKTTRQGGFGRDSPSSVIEEFREPTLELRTNQEWRAGVETEWVAV